MVELLVLAVVSIFLGIQIGKQIEYRRWCKLEDTGKAEENHEGYNIYVISEYDYKTKICGG